MALSTITSDEPITLPSVFCTKNYSHLQSSFVGILYFLTALPWEFIYAKLPNLTISIQNFHIDHNVPYLPPPPAPPPQKILHNHCIPFTLGRL